MNVLVPEAEDAEAFCFEPRSSFGVPPRLIRLTVVAAVKFDDEPSR
jgi:hypothetical protein